MSKITITDLTFYYSEYYKPIFDHVNLILDTDWRLGLVGRNGRGKTTFLHLVDGTLESDRGSIYMQEKPEYFPYNITRKYSKTIDVMKENIGKLRTMEDRMDEIIQADDEKRMEEYAEILQNYLDQDGYQIEAKIKKELNLMHLSENLLDQEYETLSGGEKTKMQIIVLFLRKNSYVMLDEPTNHLDIEGKEILAEYLKLKKGFLLVSHDREFLDQAVDHVMSINKCDILLEQGNYSTWKWNKDKKEEYEFRTRTRLTKEINALEKNTIQKRDWATESEKTKNDHGKYERSSGSRAAQFMMHAKKAQESAQKNLEEKNQLLKNYEVVPELLIDQKDTDQLKLLTIQDLSFGYTEKELFHHLSIQINQGDRIWIRGCNGCGKSTLLKFISGRLRSEQVDSIEDLNIEEVYQEPLWKEGFPAQKYTSSEEWERFLDICQTLDIDQATIDRPIETYSGGEKRKIDVARALASENDLLLLDEPLNYMDVFFREQLEKAIKSCSPTIVFVEHDERFGKNIATKIIRL